MQSMGKSALRVAKNYTRGYSDVQTAVRDATSNDPWGPSGTQMSEIAALTYNQSDFVEIMEMLDKRLNDKGKNWRHVFKSLTLLDYCLHAGSENCVMYFKENLYIVKTLKEFQYLDEFGKDQGANVRQKAKDITNLILDESRLKDQRKSRAHMRDRMNGGTGDNSRPSRGSFEDDSAADRRKPTSKPPTGGADDDMAAAIEASKRSAEDDAARSKAAGQGDREMEEAMRLSREDDERRKREVSASGGGGGLFDDDSNNLIDISGGGQQQQPMMTGMPLSSFNPYAQQQQAQQEEWARQQQMADLQRQAEEMQYMQHQQLAQQQQMQQEEYMRQQQLYQQQQQYAYQQQLQQQQQQQPQPLVPQPTAYGSNNPFSAFAPAVSTPPPLPQATYNPPVEVAASPAPSPMKQPSQQRPPKDDGKNAELARLLAAGGGLDTFGNIGNTRMPAQFTQRTGALNAQATGRPNPFGFSDSFGTPRAPAQQAQPTGQQQQNGASGNNPFFTV